MANNSLKRSALGAKASRRLGNTVIYIILALITVIWLFPFFGLIMESFKVNTAMMDGELFPEKFGFDNYIRLSVIRFCAWTMPKTVSAPTAVARS